MSRTAALVLVGAALLLAGGPAQADPISVTVFLIEAGAAAGVAAAVGTVVSFIGTYAAAIVSVGTYAYGNHQRRKAAAAARAQWLKSLQDRYIMATLTDGARQRVYGRCRTGSDIIYKRSWGDDSEIYTLLISVAGHQVHAIPEVYIGDVKVTLDADGWVQDEPWKSAARKLSASAAVTLNGSGAGSVTLPHSPWAGSVSVVQNTGGDSSTLAYTVSGNTVSITGGQPGAATVFYQHASAASHCRIRKYLGGPAQNLYPELVADFPDLQPTDRFAGDAMLRVDMVYSTEAWSGSVPPITAVVEGLALLDPRTGTTAYSTNPALFARDWSLYAHGGGLQPGELVDDSFQAAANVCDISHSFTVLDAAGAPSTVVDKLYRGGIVCRLEGNPEAYLAEMCEAMGGRYGWSGARLIVVAGAWRAPVLHIDESWFAAAESISIVPEGEEADAINTQTATIADEAHDYIVTALAPLAPAAYLTADGKERANEIEMQGVQTAYHAQHIQGVLMREARQGLSFAAALKPIGLVLDVFDVVTISIAELGWVAKPFEVQSASFALSGAMPFTFKETAAAIYDPDAGFTDLGWSDNTHLPDPAQVPLITGLAAQSGTTALQDGSILTRTQISWAPLAFAPVTQGGSIEVQYIEATAAADVASNWSVITEPGSSSDTTIAGLRTGRVYLIRARARTPLSTGAWCVQIAHKIAPPPAGDVLLSAEIFDATGIAYSNLT